MGVRLPLQKVLDVQNNGNLGAASVAGGIPQLFTIPQDADSVVVKLQASVAGGAVSTVLQTSDDGGTTWYDVGRTSVVSDANGTTAQWLFAGVAGGGIRTNVTFAGGSIITGAIGNAAASTVGSQQMTGLPILGPTNRLFHVLTGNSTLVTSVRAQVMVNSQSAGAN